MENDWGKLRLATKSLRIAAIKTAEDIASLPHAEKYLMDNTKFGDYIWQFLEDILVYRFLVTEKTVARLDQTLNNETRQKYPWSFTEFTRNLLRNEPAIVEHCIQTLEGIPCDLEDIWMLGSLYEYRTGLQIEPNFQSSSNKIHLARNPNKKRQAIYYTPRDVVDFILHHTLFPFLQDIKEKVKKGDKGESLSTFLNLSILDPSCGGGAFLVPAWNFLTRFYEENFLDESKMPVTQKLLVGIDVDPRAVQVSQFSLWLTTPQGHPLADAYTILEGNALWPGDSVIIPKFSFAEHFPLTFTKDGVKGFTCVIGNPPYAEIPPKWPMNDLARGFQTTSSKDLYTLFLEQMILLSNRNAGRGGMIVPLSLTFSKDMNSIRDFIRASGRYWKISSYHIRPSGIFPGVSQRTSIALVEPSPDNKTRVETTCVQRWSAEKRANLFTYLQYADVTKCIETLSTQGRPLGIPNIGNPQLNNLLLKLLLRGEKLGDSLVRTPRSPGNSMVLYYFTMAYHWLSVSGQLPDLRTVNKSVALSSLIPLYFANDADRWVALALLASSLGFWWWQIFGDLFHVTRGVLSQFPVNPATVDAKIKGKIISLAKDLQADISKNVTFFTKKGVTNANFDLTRCFGKIRPIDEILRNYLNVPVEEWEALYANYTETTGKKIK